MRLRIPALAAAGFAALVAVAPSAPAQAPARAGAEASVAAGDLGVVGRAAVQDGGRDSATDSAARSGMEILQGRATVRASRTGGDAGARASATAEGITLFGGLVTAERVTRTAAAEDGSPSYGGSVTGLVVDGVPRGDRGSPASWSAGGAHVTVNTDGAGLRVRLTRAVAGFASGTTVTLAEVSAEAVDGADPAATPTPAPTATPDPLDDPTPGDEPGSGGGDADGGGKPAKPKVSPAQRLARGRFVFPVYGDVRCADDFGAPRQIGAHEGNDCFAAFGSPVLAVADGTLNRVGTLPISGNRLWLKTERGDAFFYAHLSAFAPEAVSGRTVKAGTLLGFVGNTGDAEPTPPHVHFEIHPGDKDAIDPHAILTAWQDRGEVPTGGWLARYGNDTEARPGALVEVRDFIAGE
jgi:murein DD-endopeptidase MepM/ murein hydrolase activator NlpD